MSQGLSVWKHYFRSDIISSVTLDKCVPYFVSSASKYLYRSMYRKRVMIHGLNEVVTSYDVAIATPYILNVIKMFNVKDRNKVNY